jgi:aryl-alcohol dehydrogenase-like predicted oxidoreductase
MTTATDLQPIEASGRFSIGGVLPVHRLGFGAMQLTGEGIWGEPADRDECLRVLRKAVDLGVDLVDTADAYGPYVSEDLIREALHPYPDGLVIATKAGLTRAGPGDWRPVGRPAYLRQCLEMSLRRLKVERIDLYQLHRVDPDTAVADSLGELKLLQDQGKIRHIGVSEVDVKTLTKMREIVEVVSVQNLYNLSNRHHEDVLDYCEAEGLGFIPWFPLATGKLAGSGGPLDQISAEHGASQSQLALAWLLRRSPVMLPIPGTSKVAHLEDNCAAATVELSDAEFDALSAAGEG